MDHWSTRSVVIHLKIWCWRELSIIILLLSFSIICMHISWALLQWEMWCCLRVASKSKIRILVLSKSFMIATHLAVSNLSVVLFNVHVLRVELILLLSSIIALDPWLVGMTFLINLNWHWWLFTWELKFRLATHLSRKVKYSFRILLSESLLCHILLN